MRPTPSSPWRRPSSRPRRPRLAQIEIRAAGKDEASPLGFAGLAMPAREAGSPPTPSASGGANNPAGLGRDERLPRLARPGLCSRRLSGRRGAPPFVGATLARMRLAARNIPAARPAHPPRTGYVLVAAVVVHVVGLWVTSPPDIIAALLLRAQTPFSVWGIAAMWAVFAAALLSTLRRLLSARTWRIGHTSLVSIVVLSGVLHAMLIEGTMNTTSRAVLRSLAITATVDAVASPWLRARRRAPGKK